jgi:hypothetical protein
LAKVCPNCKTVNVDNASFCQKCGKELSQTSQAPQTVQTQKSKGAVRPKKSTRKNIVLGGIGLLFLLVMIWGGVSILGNHGTPTQTYNNGYLSFTYPSSWKINGNTTNDSVWMFKSDNTSFFQAMGPDPMSSVAETDGVADNMSDIANAELANTTFTNIQNINVNGIPGVLAYVNDSWTGYHAQVYFAVGNNLYWYNFFDAQPTADSDNINEFFMLINSTKAK